MGILDMFRKKRCSGTTLDQKQTTTRITKAISFSMSTDTDDLDRLARERSDMLYQERQHRIEEFDPYRICVNSQKIDLLVSVEKYFLKQMDKQSVDSPTVWGYWTYEYSLDFAVTMKKLITNDYLRISDCYEKLPFLKVPELKEVLKKFGLLCTGKKSDLIKRIQDNLSTQQLAEELADIPDRYLLTASGEYVTKNLPISATKNLELENHCLRLILDADVGGAYKFVCQNEIKKVIPRGINMDWNAEMQRGLSDFSEGLYTTFLTNELSGQIPENLLPYTMQIKACIVLGIMLGLEAGKITDLFVRFTGAQCKTRSQLVSIIQTNEFALMNAQQQYTFESLR